MQTEKEIHCKHCEAHKLLAKIHSDGKIYVWCKECRKEVELEVKTSFEGAKEIRVPPIKINSKPYK